MRFLIKLLMGTLAVLMLAGCGSRSESGCSDNCGIGDPPPEARLPASGQTMCYDSAGGSIGCAGTGQDGELQRGVVWPNPRFTDNGNGTISDHLTGLMWLQNANCIATHYPGFDNDDVAGDGAVTWQHALDFSSGVNTGSYPLCGAMHSDWRTPNTNELKSLLHAGQDPVPWLVTQGFANVQLETYWSSSTNFSATGFAWVVYFVDGSIWGGAKTARNYLWMVRDETDSAPARIPATGQTTSYAAGDDGDLRKGVAWPDPRFRDNGNGTMNDRLTGLMWLQDANCMATHYPGVDVDGVLGDGTVNWETALLFVAGLNSNLYPACNAGHNDWRLPNVREIGSLVNVDESPQVWLGVQGFTNVQDYYYWSSTSSSVNTAEAWKMHTGGGGIRHEVKDMGNMGLVWPVRGL